MAWEAFAQMFPVGLTVINGDSSDADDLRL